MLRKEELPNLARSWLELETKHVILCVVVVVTTHSKDKQFALLKIVDATSCSARLANVAYLLRICGFGCVCIYAVYHAAFYLNT